MNKSLIKIGSGLLIFGVILFIIFQKQPAQPAPINQTPTPTPRPSPLDTDEPHIVSTNPSPLDEAIILPNQTLEITFNRSIENIGEFKNDLGPKPVDYKVELSSDRKTAKIIPTKPFMLGRTYTLRILPDTKFDIKVELKREIIMHFKTINYQGV